MIEYEQLDRVNAPFAPQMEEAFGRILRKGWFVLGEEVAAFERETAVGEDMVRRKLLDIVRLIPRPVNTF